MVKEDKEKIVKSTKKRIPWNKGKITSEETKKKQSEANKGKIVSEETKQKISEANKEHIVTDETKQKISEANKGKMVSEETKQKLINANKGKVLSEKTKEKMSKVRKGHTVSDETKQKISEGNKGQIPWNKGKHLSKEHKEKLRTSTIKYIEITGFTQPNIGRNETVILNDLELKKGYKILRQFKVGGYFLDGYIPELNLAIEVDEKGHQYKIEKDFQREEFIKKELNCEFLRIKDY